MLKAFSRISVSSMLRRIEKLAITNEDGAISQWELLDSFHGHISTWVLDRTVIYLDMAGFISRKYTGGTDHDEEDSFNLWLTDKGWEKCFDMHEKRSNIILSTASNIIFLILGALLAKYM